MVRQYIVKLRSVSIQLHKPPRYLTSSLIVGLGGLLNGIDSGTIGPVTSMDSFTKSFGVISPSTLGFVVSSVLLSAILTSLFSGSLSDNFGRTRSIAIGALIFAIGAALQSAAMNLTMLILGRVIVGLGQGVFLSTLLVYVCEIAPPRKRSALATGVQLFITLGLVVGFFTCYASANIPSSLSWRLPFAIHAVIAVFLSFAAHFFLPPSPRWLVLHKRYDEAARTWDILGVSAAEREKDIIQEPDLSADLETPRDNLQGSLSNRIQQQWMLRIRNVIESFRGPARTPMLHAIFFMTFQQLSGIDGVIYYAPILFSNAGLSSNSTFLASGVSGIAIFVCTIIAVIYADSWGRRPSTIYGGFVLLCCMLLMAIMYATGSVHANYGAGRWIVIPSIYVFACAYSMTWAIGLKLYASEIQPTKTRATAMALAQAANLLSNFFVAFITPVLLSASSLGAYFMFATCLLVTILISIIFMPETKGLDLENISASMQGHSPYGIKPLRKFVALSVAFAQKLFSNSNSRARGRRAVSSIQTQDLFEGAPQSDTALSTQ